MGCLLSLQADKVYVQDRLRESGGLVWKLLQQGAHFYVCGDAAHMAGSVEQALLSIIHQHQVSLDFYMLHAPPSLQPCKSRPNASSSQILCVQQFHPFAQVLRLMDWRVLHIRGQQGLPAWLSRDLVA